MPEVHAKLSASGSKRWLACTKSISLEERMPDGDSESDFAKEGTLAHELAEKTLLNIYYPRKMPTKALETWIKASDIPAEMKRYVDEYVEYCKERVEERRLEGKTPIVVIEERVDFSNYVPGGFGTSDFTIVCDDVIDVIDLKYGKGVKVDVEENPQLRLYAIGAYNGWNWLHEGISKVTYAIMQPRLHHVAQEEISLDALEMWCTHYVKPRAIMAYRGEGEYSPGEHCKFCKANAVCKARGLDFLAKLLKIQMKGKKQDE